MEIRRVDLTEWQVMDAIVHQCNCLAVKAHGLSAQIDRKYPWVDAYRYRRRQGFRNLAIPADRKEPGTIQIMRNPGIVLRKSRKGDRSCRLDSEYQLLCLFLYLFLYLFQSPLIYRWLGDCFPHQGRRCGIGNILNCTLTGYMPKYKHIIQEPSGMICI